MGNAVFNGLPQTFRAQGIEAGRDERGDGEHDGQNSREKTRGGNTNKQPDKNVWLLLFPVSNILRHGPWCRGDLMRRRERGIHKASTFPQHPRGKPSLIHEHYKNKGFSLMALQPGTATRHQADVMDGYWLLRRGAHVVWK